ncbi:pimeloyl-ACP methyl ester carboxylesterase [Rhizobium leguminosarum]|uniref:prolyl oligopeptidase family serine peptidase n=2 Tax=Rhizobium TaxID=379 RepID=UPI0024735AB0|nr:prolyl oligopeptidase family serine peptidase [Rhizobium leguminosarum]MDH6275179.1 pimeloyl-ACP methyl ester carboxylesterase [Rhizobium leguminosarum]
MITSFKPNFSILQITWLRSAIFILLIFLTCFARISVNDLRGSDDNIWLYLTGVQLTHTKSADNLNAQLLRAVADRGANAESQLRYKMRVDYRKNYYLSSLVTGLLAAYQPVDKQGDLANYSTHIGTIFIQSCIIQTTFALIALILGVTWVRRPELTTSVALTILILGILSLVQPLENPGSFLFFDPLNSGRILQNILLFAVNPGSQFSVFGFTPRSTLLIFALLIFGWRWHGWVAASYILAAALLFLHESMAAILLANLILLDLTFRPKLLFRVSILPWIVAAALIFAWRESLWNIVLPDWDAVHIGTTLAALAIAGICVFGAIYARRWLRDHFPSWFDKAKIDGKIESLVLLLLWTSTLPIGYLISLKVDYLHGHYFWYQLHARIWSLYLPVIVLGLSCWLVEKLWKDVARHPRLAVLAPCLLVAVFVTASVHTGLSLAPFYSQLESVANNVGKPIWAPIGPAQEPEIYMAMAATTDTGRDYLTPMIDPAPGFKLTRAEDEPYLEKCNGTPKNLIVWLHTWSADLSQITEEHELLSISDACLISPNFNGIGGSNANTCGSRDSLERIHDVILDAESRHGKLPVTLIGVSGGGMHALLTLGTFPGLVQSASVWVPIYDIERWYWERPDHRPELEKCFGRPPSPNDADYLGRSPKSVLSATRAAQIIVNLGKADDETPPWHARAAVAQMRAGCPTCKIDLREWDMGHSYNKDELLDQVRHLMSKN